MTVRPVPTPWHREMRASVLDAGLTLDVNSDAVLGLCAAEIERLRAALDEITGLIDCDDAVVIARKALNDEQSGNQK